MAQIHVIEDGFFVEAARFRRKAGAFRFRLHPSLDTDAAPGQYWLAMQMHTPLNQFLADANGSMAVQNWELVGIHQAQNAHTPEPVIFQMFRLIGNPSDASGGYDGRTIGVGQKAFNQIAKVETEIDEDVFSKINSVAQLDGISFIKVGDSVHVAM